ncbi:uncharacterized protein LOC108911456 [Anoplophora glabripennis]|uniref:uncharacterized protein LOC108911456 n=1 Tax=Anoplophora glabripennis TaxID=217634 RepID=UPI000874CB0B|nr:uncharacterized protein LOC108911456 [Anoplophora glabripennis]
MLRAVVYLVVVGTILEFSEGTISLNRHEQGQIHPCLWLVVFKKHPRMTTTMPTTTAVNDAMTTTSASTDETATVITEAPTEDASDTTEEVTETLAEEMDN